MTASAGSSKAGWYIAGGIVLAVVLYKLFSRLNDISDKVDNLADKLARPQIAPEDAAPIDVTAEAVADSAPQSAIVTDSRIHSENVSQSDQNAPKAIENQAFMTIP